LTLKLAGPPIIYVKTPMPKSVTTGKSGRPPKFDGPRRPVTVTLPEQTLDRLARIDSDRARAIVALVDAAAGDDRESSPVEIVEVAPGVGILVVASSPALERIPCIRLAAIAPGRHLVALVHGTSIEAVEIALLDALREEHAVPDRPTLEALLASLSGIRRQQAVSKAEILFVAMSEPRSRGRAGAS
jgi:hypothetical protein